MDVGVTVRNQPTNEAAFTTGSYPDSSVSPGPFALLLHGGVRLDVIDELGFAAELTWPATNVEVRYGPIVSLSVQGRIDGSRADLFGLSI